MQEFRVYRKLEKGEFFLVPGDCAQGGGDFNFVPWFSYKYLDWPIVYVNDGVAATMTPEVHRGLEYTYDLTGVPPMIGLERQNGGASEMERFRSLNRHNKYLLYIMKTRGKTEGEEETKLLGWNTSSTTRPYLIGDWKDAFDSHATKIYDQQMLDHHKTFIKGRGGKPQASKGNHDDGVLAPAIGWQMYQTERPPEIISPNDSFPEEELFNKGWY